MLADMHWHELMIFSALVICRCFPVYIGQSTVAYSFRGKQDMCLSAFNPDPSVLQI